MAGIGHWYIEMEKQGYWRGAQHNWVNRYVMSGADPAASDAQSVITQLKEIEDQLHWANVSGLGVGFVEGRAYASTGGAPFTSIGYNASGAVSTATGFAGAGWTDSTQAKAPTLETCMLLETKLAGLNSRGKPKYLRKYYRGSMYGASEDNSANGIPGPDLTGIAAITAVFRTGMGTNNYVVIGVSGAQASVSPVCHPFLVAHQIPRGRKKKSSSSSNSLLSDAIRLAGDAKNVLAADA